MSRTLGRIGKACAAVLCLPLAVACGNSGPSGAAPNSETGASGLLDGRVLVEGGGCEAPAPGRAPLRRLSNAEYRNTLIDLLGNEELVAETTREFPREPTSLGFRNGADTLTVSPLLADQYLQVATELAAAIPELDVLTCSVDEGTASCIQAFVVDFGARVYRRPLTREEQQRYADLYELALRETGQFRSAIEWVGAALLSSPHFLFRVEPTLPGEAVGRPRAYEMASRLSYLLWQTMPDDELFAAAASGSLETAAGISAQVRRMVKDARAYRVYEFFEQWLDLDELDASTRDADVYPEAGPALVELLKAENRAFIYSLLSENGTFKQMLAADYTFANSALAQHYRISDAPSGDQFEKVSAKGRAGILTQATLLAHDRPTRTSIVKRGLKIRTDFLCQLVPAPPDNVNLTLPALDGTLGQRERLEEHRSNPSCAGCHSLIDPIGVLFEGFDALGRPRQQDEAGASLQTNGSVSGTKTLDGDYADAAALAAAMSESDEVRACFVRQAFRFFYGRDLTPRDACVERQLMTQFARNDYRIADLFLALTHSDQFLYREPASASEVSP